MKSKPAASNKSRSIVVKDLSTKKNPKGGYLKYSNSGTENRSAEFTVKLK